MQALNGAATRSLEFGIYRDGDNNLCDSQDEVIDQAVSVSRGDPRVQFTVEDTVNGGRSRDSVISDGTQTANGSGPARRNMASEQTLATFVARTLDNAECTGASQTWIDLVDHGAGDGGGLEADSYGRAIMPMPQMAQAIADGIAMHAHAHPEDAGRGVDGVVANQCLMASLGFADALSHAGVHYLAASPETMVSPGVPSTVAHDIAAHEGDAKAMASSMVRDVMHYRYGIGEFGYAPAAAFDVIDTSRASFGHVETAVTALNDAIAKAGVADVNHVRDDAKTVQGMARFPEATDDMPWRADRPAIGLYDKIAQDTRLSGQIRTAAASAAKSVRSIVLAHGESGAFEPFGDASYKDAVGPTTHFPVSAKQIDPWAPKVTETHNRFFAETHAAAAERAVA